MSEEHGWTIVNWCLEPFWIDDDLLQPRKVDILEKTPDASVEMMSKRKLLMIRMRWWIGWTCVIV